ncbi:MAG TPA: hypothetical protein VK809_11070 [Bacteroidia bacterium]|nr:hypothetical protein [Bacteroidia bacterium]
MATPRINALEALHIRKAELALKCKAKEQEISLQAEYISEHLGGIVINSFIGDRFKKGKEKKTEIIELLVSQGVETAMDIQKDPHDIKDKLFSAVKKSASGVINLLFK